MEPQFLRNTIEISNYDTVVSMNRAYVAKFETGTAHVGWDDGIVRSRWHHKPLIENAYMSHRLLTSALIDEWDAPRMQGMRKTGKRCSIRESNLVLRTMESVPRQSVTYHCFYSSDTMLTCYFCPYLQEKMLQLPVGRLDFITTTHRPTSSPHKLLP